MSAFGHKILYDGAGDIVADIWLVHGLRGHRIDTWTKSEAFCTTLRLETS